MQLSTEVLTARAVATAQSFAGGTLCLRTGGVPADCKSGASGTEIASLALADRMTVQGTDIVIVSSPVRALALVKGVPGYWRIEKAGKCVAQGSVGKSFPSLGEVEQGQMIEIGSWSLADTTVEAA